jgi:hypothetical protein
MARIPILRDSAQLQTGNQTQQTANLPAVTNASIGKALGDVAGVAMDIQEMSRRANDVTNLTTASLRMNEAQKEFATFQQSPEGQDETQWLPKWKELETKLQSEIGAMPLTPNARAQLTNRFSEWSTNGTINVQAGAFKQTGKRMDDAYRTSVLRKDYSSARQNLQDQHNYGFKTKEEMELGNAELDVQQKGDAVSELRSMVPDLVARGTQGDLNAWSELKTNYDNQRDLGEISDKEHAFRMREVDEGEFRSVVYTRINGTDGIPVDLTRAAKMTDESNLPSQQKLEIMSDIEKARRRYANQDLIAFANNAARGSVISGNDFDSKYMDSAELQATRDKINEAMPVSPSEEASMYINTLGMIDNINPDTIQERNPSEVAELAKVAMAISKAPAYMRDKLSSALDSKLSNKEEQSIVTEGQRKGRDMLNTILKNEESKFYQGYGTDRKIIEDKIPEWLQFQNRVFKMERDINERVKGVEDVEKINKIVLDVTGPDYESSLQQPYRSAPLNPLPKPLPRSIARPINESGFNDANLPNLGIDPNFTEGTPADPNYANPLFIK